MDRAEFEKRLLSVVIPDGTPTSEINRMLKPISEAIVEMMPRSLFRYRPCEERHIDAFERDAIYAVPADWFNDPYDTLVRYDFDSIKEYVDRFVTPTGLEQLRSYYSQGNDLPKEFKQILPDEFWDELKARVLGLTDLSGLEGRLEESKQQLLSMVSTFFPLLSFMGKRFSTIACFSEDVRSILMWSHYAGSHKGFALEYDFRPTLKQPLPGVGLYPVIYSDDRFDASPYLTWAFFTMMGVEAINPDIVASTKATLYKSKSWEYEKEWRMIDPGPHDVFNPKASVIDYRPVAIYYGHKIEEENKNRLHSIAALKGIKEYEMKIDYTSPSYEMRFRPVGEIR